MRTEDMRNTIVAMGGSVDDLPDHLPSTLKKRLIETMGGDCPEGNLPSDLREAFAGCGGGGAQNVVFADDMTTFDPRSTDWHAYITELSIPDGVSVPSGDSDETTSAFSAMTNLKKLTLSNYGRNSVGYCFAGITSLESVEIKNQERLNEGDFYGCTALKTIILGEGLKTILAYVFNSKELTELEIPSTAEYIESESFEGCTNLTKITVNKPEGSIEGAPWGATNATVIWTG